MFGTGIELTTWIRFNKCGSLLTLQTKLGLSNNARLLELMRAFWTPTVRPSFLSTTDHFPDEL